MFFDDYQIEWQVKDGDDRFADIAEERIGHPIDHNFHQTQMVQLRYLSLKKLVSWLMDGMSFCPEPVESFFITALSLFIGKEVHWDDPNVDEIMDQLFRDDGNTYVRVSDIEELSRTHEGLSEAMGILIHRGVFSSLKNGIYDLKSFALRSRRIKKNGREYINPMRKERKPPKPDPVFKLTFGYQSNEYFDDEPAIFPVVLHHSPTRDVVSHFILPAKESKEFKELVELARRVLRPTYTFSERYHRYKPDRFRLTQATEVKELGKRLYDGLFHGEIKERYLSALNNLKPGEVLRIRLCFETDHPNAIDLCNYPWELLFDGDNFLALHTLQKQTMSKYPAVTISRQFTISPPTNELAFRKKPNLTMVKLNDEKSNDKKSNDEKLKVDDELNGLQATWVSADCSIIKPRNLRELQDQLENHKPHIVHLAGHGYSLTNEEFVCELPEEDVRAHRLSKVLADARAQLVVVNCCNSLRIQQPDQHYLGLTCALTQAGIGAVVVMQSLVFDERAIEFSRIFYEQLSASNDIETALSRACYGIAQGKGVQQNWFRPILVHRPPRV